ncbi:serine hydroxymethyltransferase [Prochlorococcus sp. MIT 1307]|uniref:serine hydroxymethyltransferase n=1 Tax=Prochlorococcus sp. MIT 1307 TaxID=3096219 RepID=UPI002A747D82|nr:serine hydroxymethyltransferase [Prochlorococcus sp. MIT 1307]
MEFLLFLTAKEKEILELIYKANFSVEENSPLCLMGKKYVGFTKKRQRAVVICTQNIKETNGFYLPKVGRDNNNATAISIRKALRHEATHVAQDCNNSKLLGVINTKRKSHPWYKARAIKGSTSIGNIKREREVEAYYMEDRPKKVIAALKKFCP